MRGGLELLEVDCREELRVNARYMIALDEVVGVDLPIGVEHHALMAQRRVCLDRRLGEFANDVGQLLLERHLWLDGNEQESAPFSDWNFGQPPVGELEVRVLAEPRHIHQTS